MSAKIRIAILFLIVANIIWGASFPIYKWSLDNVPPFTFAFLRFFLASFLILPFTKNTLTIKREDLKTLFLLSFLGITLGISLMFLGLQRSTSINAPIVSSSGPIFLLLSSMIFLHETPRKRVIFGTLISLGGVISIIIGPLFSLGFDGSLLGNLLLLFSTICGVSSTILTKKIVDKYHPLTITFWSFVIGSLPLLPMVIYESMQQGGFLINLNTRGVIGILFGVIFASAIAYDLSVRGLKYIHASEVGIFSYVDPVATVIIAVPLLGEKITPFYLVSAFFVFLGIFISEGRLHWHPWRKLWE